MPRPLRIEYENAYYHVMNKGCDRQNIFHDDEYYEAFLLSLSEAHQLYKVSVDELQTTYSLVTMYMAQQYGSLKLIVIADEFGLKRTGS